MKREDLKVLGIVLLVVVAATLTGAALGTVAAKILICDYERGK